LNDTTGLEFGSLELQAARPAMRAKRPIRGVCFSNMSQISNATWGFVVDDLLESNTHAEHHDGIICYGKGVYELTSIVWVLGYATYSYVM
jgi:hypothetical protein